MKKFKDIDVAKGSQLYEAMELKDAKERKKQTEKIYKEVKNNAIKLYGQADYDWFIEQSK